MNVLYLYAYIGTYFFIIYLVYACSMFRYASDSESGEQTVLENMKEYLIDTIERTFEVGKEQAECLYGELLQCTRKKNLVGVQLLFDNCDCRPAVKSIAV